MAAELRFNSRRSVVVSSNGSVACSQPLASQIGLDILKRGGNAADAAVAVAAALNVTEPCSTGIGGDAFCLFYDAKTKSVKGLNGSGRAPAGLNLMVLSEQGFTASNPFPQRHAHSVTVPGAAAAWVDTLHKFGSNKLSLSDVLQPAISLAETGFPVQECVADSWAKSAELFKDPKNIHGRDLLLDGQAPKHGQVMKMPHLVRTFKEVAANGKKGFYTGRVAKAIVDTVQQHGGCMTLDDLATHVTTFDEPISIAYRGCRVWEMPPNGQGIVALEALNILKGFDFKEMKPNSVEYLHLLIESLRLSFADGQWYCADPTWESVPITDLLSDKYAAERRKLIDLSRAQADMVNGCPVMSSDTVYFTVADKDGNACSFINSNYMGFGTALVPEGCGFTLQNRGCGFSLDPSHPNALAPGKRPYHTIIPGMVTSSETGDLKCSFGVMGGFMQPQGHVQVLMNMIEFGMNPQQALDQPRFCIGITDDSRGNIFLEDGIPPDVMEKLRLMGHNVIGPICGWDRIVFGRGQIISRGSWWKQDGRGNSVYWSGSDSRADGQVAAY